MRSNNGQQFNVHIFQAKLRQWGVIWSNSTPNYSQSNGHAEAAVSAMKDLVANISPIGDLTSSIDMLELNTPRENGEARGRIQISELEKIK